MAQKDDAPPAVPVTLNQMRFILAHEATTANFSLTRVFRIIGQLDVARLTRCIDVIVARHDALRVVLSQCDAGMSMSLPAGCAPALTVADLRGLTGARREAAIHAEAGHRFALWSNGLFRCWLARIAEAEYVLLICVHHVICDGQSLNTLIADLGNEYSRSEGQADLVSQPEGRRFLAQAAAENTRCERSIQAALPFWRAYLQDAPAGLSIPYDTFGGPQCVFSRSAAARTLDAQDVHALEQVARATGTTLFSVVTGALGVVLSRYHAMFDLPIAFQSSGRRDSNVPSDLVGLFSRVLTLRLRPTPEDTFASYVQSVRRDVAQCLAHEDVPYHVLLTETGVRPRIDINWYPPAPCLHLSGLTVREEAVRNWDSDFDLNLYCEREGGALRLRAAYNSTFYQVTTIDRFLEQLQYLLHQVAAAPHSPISCLALAPKRADTDVPAATADTRPEPVEALHSQFVAAARRAPDAMALRSQRGNWTYAQLDATSNRLAQCLKSRAPGSVAIVTDRDPALVCAILAASKAGVTFAVIDATYPAERVALYLEIAEPGEVILCGALSSAVLEVVGRRSAPQLRLPSDPTAATRTLGKWPSNPLPPDSSATEVAYLLFTSGSTGVPKCVETPHGPLAAFVHWQVKTFSITAADRGSVLSGLSHDPLLRDIITPLSVGGCACLPEQDLLLDPARMRKWLADERITLVHLTPSLGKVLVSACEEDSHRVRQLRFFFWGGESIPAKVANEVHRRYPAARQVNFYGATETPQAVAWHELQLPVGDVVVPIGKAAAGHQLLVLAPDGRECAVGELGEICVRSRHLSHGYRAARQGDGSGPATVHVKDASGLALYRTGDLGRYDGTGSVVCIGRRDDQVKVRGYRVELGEVARAVERVDGVRDARVVARRTPEGETQLVAYARTWHSNSPAPADIKRKLLATLPHYMVPSAVAIVVEWPLLPNGKVDTGRLPNPDVGAVTSEGGAPRTRREEELARIWRDVLGTRDVGVHDSFSSLGGDSLSALRAIYRMARLGLSESDCRAIFRGETIAELAARESSTSAAERGDAPLSPLDATTLTLNLVRGGLVALIVAGHWTPGLFERLPSSLKGVEHWLTPLLSLATPGFATIFGVSLGVTYLPLYRRDPARTARLLRVGAGIVLVAILLRASTKVGRLLVEGATVDAQTISNSLYSVLLYYFCALVSAPLWLAALHAVRRPTLWLLASLPVLYGLYVLAVRLGGGLEFDVPWQLANLMGSAKFSYFNMSIGVFSGIAIGIQMRAAAEGAPPARNALRRGATLMLAGIGTSILVQRTDSWFDSGEVDPWKWATYVGLTIVLLVAGARLCDRDSTLSSPTRKGMRLMAAFGQCALPVFVLHIWVLEAKALLEALGLAEVWALLVTLGGFVMLVLLMVRRVYRLFYA